jgi:hypothetical protein
MGRRGEVIIAGPRELLLFTEEAAHLLTFEGKVLSTFALPSPVSGDKDAVINHERDVIVVGGYTAGAAAYRRSTGEKLWERRSETLRSMVEVPALSGVLLDQNQKIELISLADGTPISSEQTNYHTFSPVGAGFLCRGNDGPGWHYFDENLLQPAFIPDPEDFRMPRFPTRCGEHLFVQFSDDIHSVAIEVFDLETGGKQLGTVRMPGKLFLCWMGRSALDETALAIVERSEPEQCELWQLSLTAQKQLSEITFRPCLGRWDVDPQGRFLVSNQGHVIDVRSLMCGRELGCTPQTGGWSEVLLSSKSAEAAGPLLLKD